MTEQIPSRCYSIPWFKHYRLGSSGARLVSGRSRKTTSGCWKMIQGTPESPGRLALLPAPVDCVFRVQRSRVRSGVTALPGRGRRPASHVALPRQLWRGNVAPDPVVSGGTCSGLNLEGAQDGHRTDDVRTPESVIHRAEAMGLDTRILYEAVIELAGEGPPSPLAASTRVHPSSSISSACPSSLFRNISEGRTEAGAAHRRDQRLRHRRASRSARGRFLRRAWPSTAACGSASPRPRTATAWRRCSTTSCTGTGCITTIARFTPTIPTSSTRSNPQRERTRKEDASPFAFTRVPAMPRSTQRRLRSFLSRCRHSAVPPWLRYRPSANTDETRVMFRDDATQSPLPVIRRTAR